MAPANYKARRDFAAYVRGDHPDVKSFKRYTLLELRAAYRRAQVYAIEIQTIGEMLQQDLIDSEMALELLNETDALCLVQPSEPPLEEKGDERSTEAASTVARGADGGTEASR
jgi:hypothetical protein